MGSRYESAVKFLRDGNVGSRPRLSNQDVELHLPF
jgi:hypothetical protein